MGGNEEGLPKSNKFRKYFLGGDFLIFVTVGTHEQPFDRLVEYMDNMKRNQLLTEEVVIQTGYSMYEPQYCVWQKLFPYQKMIQLVDKARIVITHGGPSSFIMPLQMGKIPIVVPRQKLYHEHINDHQVNFTQEVAKRMGNIIAVVDINELGQVIFDYDRITRNMKNGKQSNNAKFNTELENIVNQMFKGKMKNG